MKGFGANRLLVVGGRDISAKEETSTSSSGKKILSAKKPISKLNVQDISIALAIFPEFFTQGLDQYLLIHQSEKYTSISNTNLTVRNQHPPSDCGGLALWFIREYGLQEQTTRWRHWRTLGTSLRVTNNLSGLQFLNILALTNSSHLNMNCEQFSPRWGFLVKQHKTNQVFLE